MLYFSRTLPDEPRTVSSDQMEVIPLGGLGEFGMNMMAIRHAGTILVVDAGLMFPRNDLLGVDLVVPDLRYLVEHKDEVKAIVLTHGHEDHIGALPYFLDEIPAPVYGTPLTLAFAEGRLSEHGLLDRVQLNRVQARDTLQVGDMHLEFLRVTHSIADSIGLAITTDLGTLIHTGDFKFDQSPPDGKTTDYSRFSYYGERGVLALFSDSTNSERPGYTPSENHVQRHLEQIFHTSQGKIIVACFASSIHRIQIILDLAREFRRRVVLVGRSMKENLGIARGMGYISVPAGTLADINEGLQLPADQIVLLATGSQGEPMAALGKLALDKHKNFRVEPDDSIIISARAIPGNESRISHLINHFCRRGAKVYDESRWSIHVSGHASQEELKLMLNLTRPRFFVPIHGEYRQLYHHTLVAQETGITKDRILLAETGDIITFTSDGAGIRGKAPVGRRLLDDSGMADVDEFMIRDRQHLSEEGVVLAVVAINKSTGELEGLPELVSRGHLDEKGVSAILAEGKQIVLNTLKESTEEERADSLVLTEMIRADLKRFFRKRTGTRPMIVPLVLEI
jgi:ribonuclease J